MAIRTEPKPIFLGCILAAFVCGLLLRGADGQEAAWPAFLPPRNAVPDGEAVRAVWANATFERQLEAPPPRAPRAVYVALIDAPDVLASGANHLGLTNETAEALPDGTFMLKSPNGSYASYRVISNEPDRRVLFSRGEHVVFGVGVKAAVLGVLSLSNREDGLHQNLKVYVRVMNPLLSWLTQAVRVVLPSLADKELLRGFRLAREVAEWASNERPGFCRWLSANRPTERTRSVSAAAGC